MILTTRSSLAVSYQSSHDDGTVVAAAAAAADNHDVIKGCHCYAINLSADEWIEEFVEIKKDRISTCPSGVGGSVPGIVGISSLHNAFTALERNENNEGNRENEG